MSMSRLSAHLRSFVSYLAWSCGGFVVVAAILFAPKTWAANGSVNQQISYQAKLSDTSGFPVADASYAMKFSVYDASTGGNRLWTATGTLASPGAINVSSTNGLFTLNLGDTSAGGQWQNVLPMNIWNNDSLFLGVTIDADAEMTPRRRLTSAPQALNAMQLQGMYASGTVWGGESLFAIHQTETSVATGTRTALQVKSRGTSPVNDFLIRGLNAADNSVFHVDIDGGVSASGTVTSTALYATTLQALNASSTNATATTMSLASSINNVITANTIFSIASSTNVNDTPRDIAVVGRYAYVITGDDKLTIYDITNPSSPSSTGSVSLFGTTDPVRVVVDGRYAYVANYSFGSIEIFDVSKPANPIFVKSIFPIGVPTDIAVRGGYIYVSTEAFNTFEVIDVRRPDQARSVHSVALSSVPNGLVIQGRYAYAVSNDVSSLYILDLQDPARPTLVSTTVVNGGAGVSDIAVQGRYVYLTDDAQAAALNAYDIANPAAPHFVSAVATSDLNIPSNFGPQMTGNLVAAGRYVFVPGALGLNVFDVQNPTNMVHAKSFALGGMAIGIAVSGRYAYTLLPATDKLVAVDIGGTETISLKTSTVETGFLQVLSDGRIGNMLTVDGGVAVGRGGIVSDGQLSIYATNTTSSIMGNLVVGTTTGNIVLNALFVTDGDDLFVGGNIGSASSVYTNGAFVAGSGSTWYGNGFINQNSGNLTLQASGGYILPASDNGVSFGSNSLRYNGYFGDVTSTNATTTNFAVSGSNTSTFAGGISASGNVSSTWLVADQGLMVRGGSLFVNPSNGYVGLNTLNPLNSLSIVGGMDVNAAIFSSSMYISAVIEQTSVGTSSFGGSIVVGTSTYGGGINSLFDGDANDLFVESNLGAASSVYTNGAFVAGQSNPLYVMNNVINQTSGNLTLNAAGGYILPASDNGVSIGSSALRYNAYFGGVTSSAATSTNFFATALEASSASTTYATSTNFAVENTLRKIVTAQTGMYVASTTYWGGASQIKPYDLAIEGHYLYFVDWDNSRMQIADISNPVNPSSTGILELGGSPSALTVAGQYAYIAHQNSKVSVVDVSSPANPSIVSTITLADNVNDLVVSGRYLYATEYGNNSLAVVDIANPNAPLFVKRLANLNRPYGLAIARGRLYVTELNDGRLTSFDLYGGTLSATNTGSITGLGSPASVVIQGRYAYVPDSGSNNLYVLDISYSGAPRLVATYNLLAIPTHHASFISGRYLYVLAQNSKLLVIDLTNPVSPALYQSITFAAGLFAEGIAIQGRYAYVGAYTAGQIGVIDLTGIETNTLVAHDAQIGNMDVSNDAHIVGSVNINGSLHVGQQGIFSNGPIASVATSSSSTSQFINFADGGSGTAWGAYINRLLVGVTSTATGTADFWQVISYNSAYTAGGSGLCIDDINTASTCLATSTASIQADGVINAGSFDLAEYYAMSGVVNPGDVLVLNTTASSTVKASNGTPYDGKIIGVASTNPGFLLGFSGGAKVALTGRVPVKFSPYNGSVSAGDALTSSPTPGMAMKATKPGRIIGYALESSSVTSTVEVFVKVGYEAGMVLNTDGTIAQISDDVVVSPRVIATSEQPTQDSWGFTFRGSAWDGTQAITTDFTLLNDVLSSTSSRFTLRNTLASSVFSIDQSGTARVAGDLIVGGRLFPSAAGFAQTDSYIFVDRASSPTSTYIATNADGWQSNTSYDFAERYYSPDALEPGDLVIVSRSGQIHVQRAWDEKTSLVGIVSTRPGFVAGAPATSTFPIALAGRVPTKVSTIKGAIHAGDLLAPSTIPGVAVKAVEVGPVVGQALEMYDAEDVGKIEAFVNPGWWGGGEREARDVERAASEPSDYPTTRPLNYSPPQHGIALVAAGAKYVRITFPSLLAFPNAQVTPRGEVDGGWWTDNYSDTGFDIRLKQAQTHDVVFMWSVMPLQEGERAFVSDGTTADVHALTGEIRTTRPAAATSTEEIPIVIIPQTQATTSADELTSSDTATTSSTEQTE